MRNKFALANVLVWIFAALFLLAGFTARADAPDMKLEAHLIWATNDKQDPDPKHKPVSPEIKSKLAELPLKWSNYFEVNRVETEVPKGESRRAKLSEKCEIEIKNIDGSQIQVSLLGKNDPIWKRIQSMSKGDILVLGGNAPNSTAWLVALKRIK